MLAAVGLTAAAGAGAAFFSRGGGAATNGRSRALAIASDPIPTATDVVVIGGGFVGVCTALALAESGVAVTLCEKGVIAGEASGRSVGEVAWEPSTSRRYELTQLTRRLWGEMNDRVQADAGYRHAGVLQLFQSETQLDVARSHLSSEHAARLRVLSRREIEPMLGRSSGDARWTHALYEPDLGTVEPRLAAPRIAEAARRHGARIVQSCAVRGIETSAGRISAVVTEHGVIKASAVVLAGGFWSPLFMRSLGLPLPQMQSFASICSIEPIENGPEGVGMADGVMWRREPDGGYTVAIMNGATPITPSTFRNLLAFVPAMRAFWNYVDPVFDTATFMREWSTPTTWPLDRSSPFEAMRVYEPEVRDAFVTPALKKLRGVAPAFHRAVERERWAGALVTTPDNLPVISAVERIPGLFLGTGFYWGLTQAPAAGQLLSELVRARAPSIDLSAYRYERFSDGSTLAFEA